MSFWLPSPTKRGKLTSQKEKQMAPTQPGSARPRRRSIETENLRIRENREEKGEKIVRRIGREREGDWGAYLGVKNQRKSADHREEGRGEVRRLRRSLWSARRSSKGAVSNWITTAELENERKKIPPGAAEAERQKGRLGPGQTCCRQRGGGTKSRHGLDRRNVDEDGSHEKKEGERTWF